MPMHINAPSTKLTPTASAKRQPARANAVPPGGNAPRFFNTKKNAAMSSATPMNSWIVRRGSRLTRPAPSQAPAVALATMQASSTGSTVTAVTNSTVSRKADAVCPTLSVPGISSSAGLPRNLNSAVVGANEPMPSVSRKSVTSPIAMSASPGRSRNRWRLTAQIHPMTNAMLTSTSTVSSPTFVAFMSVPVA